MERVGTVLPLYMVLPFVLLLACIAVLPLAVPHFWESNRNKALVTALLAAPLVMALLSANPEGLRHSVLEYLSFIALLGSLYTIAGGIHIAGDLRATPRNNTLLLAVGALLANVVGTTGASMVMIRILLSTNSERKNTRHLPLFFILIVSNCAGLLTPLGDPPLFLGYLKGVPFLWTLSLWPFWLIANGYLLAVFFVADTRAYRHEQGSDIARDERQVQPLRIHGGANVVLLALVIASIFVPTPFRELAMLCLTLASVLALPKEPRTRNKFSFGPIAEVAILFAGIFVTMVPALTLLELRGSELGLTAPHHFFVVTGALSSVLDNAPTYLTFLSAAQGMHMAEQVVGIPHVYLAAISLGAVFMGANTYIGNGPNFMVKAIADEAGYKTHSFFGYAWRAVLLLAPVYVGIIFLLGFFY